MFCIEAGTKRPLPYEEEEEEEIETSSVDVPYEPEQVQEEEEEELHSLFVPYTQLPREEEDEVEEDMPEPHQMAWWESDYFRHQRRLYQEEQLERMRLEEEGEEEEDLPPTQSPSRSLSPYLPPTQVSPSPREYETQNSPPAM